MRVDRRMLGLLAAVVAAVLAPMWTAAAAGAEPGSRTYRPPVSSPVADPFRPPPQPWLAGNRGIEYATPPGTQVRAIGPGVVTFAGLVAGERDVTVRHPDGLRSSYVDLATARVRLGDTVSAGQVIGLSTDRLHLGVRRGATYIDPASLWGTDVTGGRVILVPEQSGGDARDGRRSEPSASEPRLRPVPALGTFVRAGIAQAWSVLVDRIAEAG